MAIWIFYIYTYILELAWQFLQNVGGIFIELDIPNNIESSNPWTWYVLPLIHVFSFLSAIFVKIFHIFY